MNLKTILAAAVAATLTTAATANTCDRTLTLLTMTEDGFQKSATVTVDRGMLVCDYEQLALQSQVDEMRQQRGWYGTQWEDDVGVTHRLTDPAVSRWTQGFNHFFGGESSLTHMKMM